MVHQVDCDHGHRLSFAEIKDLGRRTATWDKSTNLDEVIKCDGLCLHSTFYQKRAD